MGIQRGLIKIQICLLKFERKKNKAFFQPCFLFILFELNCFLIKKYKQNVLYLKDVFYICVKAQVL